MADDGIKLTDAEMALSFTVAGDDQFHDELFDAETVAHIVAARVQALTAELDELRGALNDQCDWGNAVAERDAARAELAAANARIAELEGELRQWKNRMRVSVRERSVWAHEAGQHAGDTPFQHCPLCEAAFHRAENAALSARLERVTAVVDDWSVIFGPGSTMGKGSVMWEELFAALGRTHE